MTGRIWVETRGSAPQEFPFLQISYAKYELPMRIAAMVMAVWAVACALGFIFGAWLPEFLKVNGWTFAGSLFSAVGTTGYWLLSKMDADGNNRP